jgi:hypothetical protein
LGLGDGEESGEVSEVVPAICKRPLPCHNTTVTYNN